MSNKEMKDGLQEDTSGVSDENTGIEEEINATMDKIIAPPETDEDEMDDLGDYDDSAAEEPDPQPVRHHRKSARPGPVVYVPVDDMEMPDQSTSRKKKSRKTNTQKNRSAKPEYQNSKPAKKHKGARIFGLIMLMIVVLGGSAYAAASYYFADRFFEGTWINGVNCSQMTAAEVENLFKQKFENYTIEVSARDQAPQTISGADISYQYLSTGEVLKLLKQQKPYEWVKGFMETRSYTTQENVTFDKSLLQSEVKELKCAQSENQVEPENAYVALEGSEFTIVPETEGSKLKVKEAYKALDTAISGSQTSIDLGNTPDVYAVAAVTSDDPTLQATRDAYNNYTKASITYTFGEQTVTLDGSTLKEWLQFDDKGQLVQDDASFTQHIKDFVAQLASEHDTVGTTRSFNTTSGRTVSVYGSAYGWKIDQDAEAAQLTEEIRTGTQTTREPVYSMRANSYGYNDIGSTYIEVDLSSQHMYYYQNGSIIFDSDIVSGDIRYDDRATPPGIFTLYYKKSPDVLRGEKKPDGTYEYETQVTYWMPFNGGIGFHDATWQAYFGGDRYTYAGSHGCINMPLDAAATLYSIIDTNVPIVCFY